MKIEVLKQRLDIYEVAERLGIEINRYHKAICPFHDDKRPSLQFSKEKQIATCFSGNCTAGTMDAINLVENRLSLSTKEAIAWLAKEFSITDASFIKDESSTPGVNYTKLFKVFESNLKKSKKAQEYLASRGLLLRSVGYNASMWEKMRNCIIYPLRDKKGNIVSFYGRRVAADNKSNHYYSKDRKGLYPKYPEPEAKTLVLTESVIDAATLKQYTEIEVLALYGTNGLTPEHTEAVSQLEKLEEIILFLDGDPGGRGATQKYLKLFSEQYPNVKISHIATPEGEDINSLAVNHEGSEKELFEELINQSIFFTKAETSQPKPKSSNLNTAIPELLTYDHGILAIKVLGGIKITGLDRLRVTLKISNIEDYSLLPIRHNLDLYHSGQTEQLSQKVAEQMGVTSREATQVLAQLTNELETYRTQRLEILKPKKESKPQLSQREKEAALKTLKSPNLITETLEKIKESGIVGEERNALIAYLVYTSRKRAAPLHLMCLGASGTGKTYLQEKVGELMPEEDKLEITTLSENAFYYFGKEELKHKLILIEDLDGAETALYPLRELQSKRKISKTVTLKDAKGNLKTVTLKVEGPVCVSGCTTRERIYEDNANRCLLLYIDTSGEQDKKIMLYQQAVSQGTINKVKEAAAKQSLKNMQRLLSPVAIRNPYASMIQLPETVFKPRRTMMMLLSFIETITYYHQYQRRRITADNQEYILTEVEDIEWGFRLLKEVLFSKSDELSGACRKFFERLKSIVKEEQSFNGKVIRQQLRIAPSTLRRYLFDLNRYGYIKVIGGSKYKGLEYQILDYKEYEQLRSDIDKQLEKIIKEIKRVCDPK